MTLLRTWWSLVCFFFWRQRFLQQAVRHAIDRERGVNKQFAQDFGQYPNVDAVRNVAEKTRKNAEKNTRRLSRSITGSLGAILCMLVTAAWTALMMPSLPTGTLTVLRLSSGVLILWAVLGRLGQGEQTWGGQTLPEVVNRKWFVLASTLGLYLLFLSVLAPVL